MKIITTALLAAGMASLAACGGGGANNAAASNNVTELAPVEEGNVTDLNTPAPDLNAAPAADLNATSNATNTTNAL
jgi:hypothetical protein